MQYVYLLYGTREISHEMAKTVLLPQSYKLLNTQRIDGILAYVQS